MILVLNTYMCVFIYSKTCVKRPLSKETKIGFQDQLSLNAGQKYCRMPQGEHSAILSTIINLPIVIKIITLSIFEWRFIQVLLYIHFLEYMSNKGSGQYVWRHRLV